MAQDDDEKLWDYVKQSIHPLQDQDVFSEFIDQDASQGPVSPPPKSKKDSLNRYTLKNALPLEKKQVKPQIKSRSMDRRTEQKLKRGKIPIDRKIDLHGLNQGEAHRLLNSTLLGAYDRNERLVLVITGKGLRSAEPGGVLRRRVREWCDLPPLSDIVLRLTHARPHHGGEGAYYIYLRR